MCNSIGYRLQSMRLFNSPNVHTLWSFLWYGVDNPVERNIRFSLQMSRVLMMSHQWEGWTNSVFSILTDDASVASIFVNALGELLMSASIL
jgi:hypothetical protein